MLRERLRCCGPPGSPTSYSTNSPLPSSPWTLMPPWVPQPSPRVLGPPGPTTLPVSTALPVLGPSVLPNWHVSTQAWAAGSVPRVRPPFCCAFFKLVVSSFLRASWEGTWQKRSLLVCWRVAAPRRPGSLTMRGSGCVKSVPNGHTMTDDDDGSGERKPAGSPQTLTVRGSVPGGQQVSVKITV